MEGDGENENAERARTKMRATRLQIMEEFVAKQGPQGEQEKHPQ